MSSRSALRLEGLCKRFGPREVVKDLSFEVERGECFGFLGPNGSGKSTTLRMLVTLLAPSAGEAFVGEDSIRDVEAVRRRIGVVFQDPSLDLRLKAIENLDYYAALYVPRWRAAERRCKAMELLDLVGLADRAEDLVGTFSWGMRRRLEIARALVSDPEVLFLDEPTTGLDPQTRHALWEHLLRLRSERGLTLFVATHDMEEAARCGRLAVIDQGRLVALGSPETLRQGVDAADLSSAFLRLTGHEMPREGRSDQVLPRGRDGTAYRRG
jgi:ABC-2 type transport system ATP-binding protein